MIKTYTLSGQLFQRGNILFMSITLLAALSVLGLSSMRTALTEEKISQSTLDLNISTEAAESALRHAQHQLKIAPQKTVQAGYTKSYVLGANPPNLGDWENDVYQLEISDMLLDRSSEALSTDAKVAAWMPKYKLEEFFVSSNELDTGSSVSAEEKEPRSTSYFRIIARGLGLDERNETLLESVVIEQTR